MLLFITFICSYTCLYPYFNTSHVTVYPLLLCPSNLHPSISIHLMLLFIAERRGWNACGIFISIHLMLLFIYFNSEHSSIHTIFQYISCYCLSFLTNYTHFIICISIHLMLLFIGSLYSSILFLLTDFNTSHVTVYQSEEDEMPAVYSFQYISCYCLSYWAAGATVTFT